MAKTDLLKRLERLEAARREIESLVDLESLQRLIAEPFDCFSLRQWLVSKFQSGQLRFTEQGSIEVSATLVCPDTYHADLSAVARALNAHIEQPDTVFIPLTLNDCYNLLRFKGEIGLADEWHQAHDRHMAGYYARLLDIALDAYYKQTDERFTSMDQAWPWIDPLIVDIQHEGIERLIDETA